jgi:D-alanyl-D-alanine carboxypeptidase/D-alanyl-D-alanine-endopeptidase (penicillin-binding protein 4)
LLIQFRRLFAVLVLAAFLAPSLTPDGFAAPLESIQTKITKFLKRPGVRSVQWGIQILDTATQEVLVEVNPDKAFLPASVLKVVTTSTAIEKLGPDFRYRTRVYTNGKVEPDGTVIGDLILAGCGDPNLVDTYDELFEKPGLSDLAAKLKSLGISKVQGDIIGDDSYFDSKNTVSGWTATHLKSLYGAPVNALSINNNVVWIQVRPTQYKKPVSIDIAPNTSYFRIRNQATTGKRRSRQTLRARLVPGTNTLIVSGVLPSTRISSWKNRPKPLQPCLKKSCRNTA